MTEVEKPYQTVIFEVGADHVATITLNRPKVMNCFNQLMLDEFADIWRICRGDDDIHAMVSTNAAKAFGLEDDVKRAKAAKN